MRSFSEDFRKALPRSELSKSINPCYRDQPVGSSRTPISANPRRRTTNYCTINFRVTACWTAAPPDGTEPVTVSV